MTKKKSDRSVKTSLPTRSARILPCQSKTTKSPFEQKIDRAFRLMRTAGLIAKQTSEWAETCATGMLILDDKVVYRGKRPFGFAYWHRQDDEDSEVWIGHGVLTDCNLAPIQSDQAVAKTICECLVKAGVPHVRIGDWKILVLQSSAMQHADPTSAQASMEFLALEPTGRVI
jgi:hypothetical protein